MIDYGLRLYEADELGKDGYPPQWHATIKQLVRAEAGDRCERCGHPYRCGEQGNGEWSHCDGECTHGGPMRAWCLQLDGGGAWEPFDPTPEACGPAVRAVAPAPVQARWRILTVHHLDGDKANCRWWNLAALCQRCHLEIQGKVVMDRPWPWEHTGWFKPHAAGFYALKYLGLEVTREAASRRLEDLLALGRREEAVERMEV